MLGSVKCSTCSVPARKVLLETGLWLCSICQVTRATRRSHVHLGGFNLKADLPVFYIYLILMWRSEDSNDSLSNFKKKLYSLRILYLVQELSGRTWKQLNVTAELENSFPKRSVYFGGSVLIPYFSLRSLSCSSFFFVSIFWNACN